MISEGQTISSVVHIWKTIKIISTFGKWGKPKFLRGLQHNLHRPWNRSIPELPGLLRSSWQWKPWRPSSSGPRHGGKHGESSQQRWQSRDPQSGWSHIWRATQGCWTDPRLRTEKEKPLCITLTRISHLKLMRPNRYLLATITIQSYQVQKTFGWLTSL